MGGGSALNSQRPVVLVGKGVCYDTGGETLVIDQLSFSALSFPLCTSLSSPYLLSSSIYYIISHTRLFCLLHLLLVGINLKSASSMKTMKHDMGGSAAALGTFLALSQTG